jgi:hypothetical protein
VEWVSDFPDITGMAGSAIFRQTHGPGVSMSKSDRLSRLIEIYLSGELDLDTAAAEVTHVYVQRGWHFVLVEAECQPRYREPMRRLAARVHAPVIEIL